MLAGRLRGPLIAQVAMLGVILLVAAWLRIAGHNWDEGQQINVDDFYVSKVALKKLKLPPDTSLGTLLDPRLSPLNPRVDGEFFVYGTLPIYVVKATSVAISAVTGNPYFDGLGGIQQTGRIVTALFDTITVLLVFAVGALLWGAWAGLVACAIYALAALPVQFSHFFITDPFMATFMTATLLCSVLFYQTRRSLFLLLAGLCVGLAMACKLSAAPAVALPIAAALMRALPAELNASRKIDWRHALAWIGLALGGAFLGLLAGDPFAILDALNLPGILSTQASIQSGEIDQWFTRKYVGTCPVAHLWGQLILLGAGPVVGLAGMAGLGNVITRVWRERRWADSLLLVGAGIYFASIALVEIKWVRYLVVLVPYLCLFATAFGFWVYERAAYRGMGPIQRCAVLAALLVSALIGGLAVNTIFRTEHTQIEASRWVYSNVPPGSRIGIEKTALEMPLPLNEYKEQRKGYTLVSMDPLADLPSQKAVEHPAHSIA